GCVCWGRPPPPPAASSRCRWQTSFALPVESFALPPETSAPRPSGPTPAAPPARTSRQGHPDTKEPLS
ncbi:hypothetical protein, partial [Nonomuraea sp. NPDC059022]|uniref:hypothetical protein n=1 Tax=Nonomuraea sp. NPDC059022 TaxID=3346705 RepID=UPI003679E62E